MQPPKQIVQYTAENENARDGQEGKNRSTKSTQFVGNRFLSSCSIDEALDMEKTETRMKGDREETR